MYKTINLIFWLGILAYLLIDINENYIRFEKNRKYIIAMCIISSIHIVAYFYLGFIFGFSKSPYCQSLWTFLQNIVIKIIPILGMELLRCVIVTRYKNNKFVLIGVTVFLILMDINFYTVFELINNREEMFKYICSSIMPLIACNSLYTYLSLKGSYSLVLMYRLYRDFSAILIPIIPNINWFIQGTIGILSPAFVYVLFKYKFVREKKNIKKRKYAIVDKLNYAVTFTLLFTLVLFMLGAFKYEPITILSNSMKPVFSKGDVVIYEKLSKEELMKLPENAIIIYKIGEQNIAHRVIQKLEENNTVLYKTKGDNNNVADKNWVEIDQILGVYKFSIKYIGYPSVFLYYYFNNAVT